MLPCLMRGSCSSQAKRREQDKGTHSSLRKRPKTRGFGEAKGNSVDPPLPQDSQAQQSTIPAAKPRPACSSPANQPPAPHAPVFCLSLETLLSLFLSLLMPKLDSYQSVISSLETFLTSSQYQPQPTSPSMCRTAIACFISAQDVLLTFPTVPGNTLHLIVFPFHWTVSSS